MFVCVICSYLVLAASVFHTIVILFFHQGMLIENGKAVRWPWRNAIPLKSASGSGVVLRISLTWMFEIVIAQQLQAKM